MSKDDASKIIDLTGVDDFSYSAVMRKLRQKCDESVVREFQDLFKKLYDVHAFTNNAEDVSKLVLVKTLKIFETKHKVKIDDALIKSASAFPSGGTVQAGRYLADLIRFLTSRIDPAKRPLALRRLSRKILALNEYEIANKNTPVSSSLGQSITLVKNILTDHDAGYIREVLNNLARYLAG